MDLQRKIRALANKINPAPAKTTPPQQNAGSSQGMATLIVMLAVLMIIIMFCCFAAPGVRNLCKRYIFRSCTIDDPDADNVGTPAPESTTPTIILLPYGRMLVVDRSVFAQLQADQTGIDFMELSANLIRAQRHQAGSTPSILDSDTTSKGLSPMSLGFSPPAYDDIFGDKAPTELPPSYSELSLMFRNYNRQMNCESIEMCSFNELDVVPNNNSDNISDTDINNDNNINKELDESGSVHIDIEEDPSTSNPVDECLDERGSAVKRSNSKESCM